MMRQLAIPWSVSMALSILLWTIGIPISKAWMTHPQQRPRLLQHCTALPAHRQRKTIQLEDGETSTLISRSVPIEDDWHITIWEREKPAQVVEAYWNAQMSNMMDGIVSKRVLDPFGIVSWPGSVVAARELRKKMTTGGTVLVWGAGVGLEVQAAMMCGAAHVIATDIQPLKQCEVGVRAANLTGTVEFRRFDLFRSDYIAADLIVVADVLYDEDLAKQVCMRCAEAMKQNPRTQILITDSQRFVSQFPDDLQRSLGDAVKVEWSEHVLRSFEGSGVAIDEDQVYDVTVRSAWVNLQ